MSLTRSQLEDMPEGSVVRRTDGWEQHKMYVKSGPSWNFVDSDGVKICAYSSRLAWLGVKEVSPLEQLAILGRNSNSIEAENG